MSLPACRCGADATVFIPGSVTSYNTERAPDGSVLFRTVKRAAYETEAFCMPHAIEAGWPWLQSEADPPESRPRKAR